MLQLRLVEDLLELNRATRDKLALHLKVLRLDQVIGGALETIVDSAQKKRITVTFVDAEEPLCVEVDQDRHDWCGTRE